MRRAIIIGVSIAIVLAVLIVSLLYLRRQGSADSTSGKDDNRGSGLLGSDAKKPSGSRVDPAKEKYLEARRLFLTCDPGNYEKAMQYLEDALTIRNDYPEALAAWSELVSMWYGFMIPEETYQVAYARAQRAIRLAPELDAGYRAMADVFRHHCEPGGGRCDTEYALDLIERAIAINPGSAENWYVKGSIYLAVDIGEAIGFFDQAIKLNPNLAKTYFNLGVAHQMAAVKILEDTGGDPEKIKEVEPQIKSHYQDAEKNLKTFQKMTPGALSGYGMLGIVYFSNGEWQSAEEMFLKTLSVNPNPDPSQTKWRVMSYFHLAILAGMKGDYERAKRYALSSLELAPKNLDTIGQLIKICEALNDQECQKTYQQMFETVKTSQQPIKAPEPSAPEPTDETGAAAGGTLETPDPPE